MRFAYRGNHAAPHSTETEITKALWGLGHEVDRIQEDEVGWPETIARCRDADVFLWTSTHSFAKKWSKGAAVAAVSTLNDLLPTVAVHLDRFWGLARQWQIAEEPWFRLSLVCTAEGGHEEDWQRAGVNHRWFPPAVSVFECNGGTPRKEFRSEVAFVGSWHGYGHTEWTHRPHLIRWLRQHYEGRLRLWPAHQQPAVRGDALKDLYASVDVAVGDSCLVPNADGSPCRAYCSDRVPETIGRGCFLLHPHVEGVTDGTLYTDGEHLVTWPLEDWATLAEKIDYYLAHPDEREKIARAGREHVMRHHTYTRRMADLIEAL